ADGVVIGVEEVVVTLVDRGVARRVLAEAEALEEPGDMREVPLRGADLRDRLDDLILGRQRLREREARVPHVLVARRQRFGLERRGQWRWCDGHRRFVVRAGVESAAERVPA